MKSITNFYGGMEHVTEIRDVIFKMAVLNKILKENWESFSDEIVSAVLCADWIGLFLYGRFTGCLFDFRSLCQLIMICCSYFGHSDLRAHSF